eukprot:jgi/Mesen1/6871/ME000352S05933
MKPRLTPKPFFSNFGAICTFALLGTVIATVVTGLLVYIAGFLFLIYRLPFLESLVYGAVISATDPVTVLAIFQELGADTNLYALVFGESVLNDAAAIVMYRTLKSIIQNPSGNYTVLFAFQYAGITLVGSLSIALTEAHLFKYAGLAVRNLHNLECCLIVLFPYIAYMVAEGYALSGIVAILFCGIAGAGNANENGDVRRQLMKHYTFPNLSDMAQVLSAGFFQLISSLAETFTWANIVPCAYLINWFRPPSKRIPENYQKALWCSGLRGAMAFALALQSVHDLPEGHGQAIFTSTTAIVMLTVLGIGGSTSTILEKLDVVGDRHPRLENVDDSDEELQHLTDRRQELHEADDGHYVGPQEMLQRRLRILQESTPTFTSLDSKYLRPFFTAQSDDGDTHSIQGSVHSEAPNGNAQVEMSCLSPPPARHSAAVSEAEAAAAAGAASAGPRKPRPLRILADRSVSDPSLPALREEAGVMPSPGSSSMSVPRISPPAMAAASLVRSNSADTRRLGPGAGRGLNHGGAYGGGGGGGGGSSGELRRLPLPPPGAVSSGSDDRSSSRRSVPPGEKPSSD